MAKPPEAPTGRRGERPASPRATPGSQRNDILDAAMKAFARDTFDGASLYAIAEAAKVAQPSIHYHFGSKENLWKAAVEHAMEDFRNFLQVMDPATVDLDPVDVLKIFCRSFLIYSFRRPEHVMLIYNEMRYPGARLDWLVENHVRPLHLYLDQLLARAVAQGRLKPIPLAHLAPTIVISLTHYFTMSPLLKVLYEQDPLDPVIAEAQANHVIEILFEGILSSASRDRA